MMNTTDEAGRRRAEMLARHLGERIVAAVESDDVTEIYVNSDGRVRTDTRSGGRIELAERIAPFRIEMFLNAVADSMGRTLGSDAPLLEAELPRERFRGARLMGFVPPVTSAPAFNIRVPASRVYSLDEYVSAGIVLPWMREAIGRAVVSHHNILVAGATNSGKTTLCNAILREITERFPTERIVVLEDTVELQCAARDHVALRTTPGVTLAQLVRATMRASPNRIVVGEVRGVEALDLLDVWATGHPGGCGTIHADDAAGALARIDRLAQRSGVPSQRHLVAEAIHLVAVIRGGSHGRRVTELARVSGLDRDGEFVLTSLHAGDVPCEPPTSVPPSPSRVLPPATAA